MSGLFISRWLRGLSIFFFVFFFCLGCAHRQDVSSEGPEPDSNSSTDILPLYPHVLGWEDPTLHGAGFSLYGLDACLSCHQADVTPSTGPLACKACHTLFPHSDQWLDPNHHGRYVIAHGTNSCATQCHGTDFQGGLSRVSCNSSTCHTVYPHRAIANWAGSAHGLMAVDLSNRNGCKHCHGEDLLGGVSGISCKGCHTEFPHPGNWKELQHTTETRETCDEIESECRVENIDISHVSLHGQRFMEQKVAGFPATPNTCSTCHGADYEGGNSQKSCISCHPFYPHIKYEPNWKVTDLLATPLGGQHAPAFLSGTHHFTSACTQCHPRFGGGLDVLGLDASVQAPACNSCHVLYPHLRPPDVPAADDWVTGTIASSHHGWNFFLETFGEGPNRPNACKACHGNDLLGMGSPDKNCAGCHEHFGSVSHEGCCRVSSHPGGPWRQTSHHGNVYLNSLAGGNTFAGRCGKCHSSSLKRDPKVCNPYPGDRDACNICHKAPAVACSVALCAGMSAEGVCP